MIAKVEIKHLLRLSSSKKSFLILIAIIIDSILGLIIGKPVFFYFGSVDRSVWTIVIIFCSIIAEVPIYNRAFMWFVTIVRTKNCIAIKCFNNKVLAIRIAEHYFSTFFRKPIAFIDKLPVLDDRQQFYYRMLKMSVRINWSQRNKRDH